jgi:hypothetical protein
VVVSGLARGVDAEAHRGALEAGGTTVAVLGCGIDRDYPAAHAELARRIGVAGLVVSEYAPGIEPAPWRFPARNRIIAGLARATVVVEAREASGALITADFALEEGREVFAVPGEITSSLSAGTNALLRLGATPLTSAADVLEALGVAAPEAPEPELGADAAAVLALLGHGPATADELTRASGLEAGAVGAALVELELAGLAVAVAGVVARGRSGTLLVAAGATWLMAEWNSPGALDAVVFTGGLLATEAAAPIVAHAALTFAAAGRAVLDRAAIATAYACPALMVGLAPALVSDPRAHGCGSCPADVAALVDGPGVAEWLQRWGPAWERSRSPRRARSPWFGCGAPPSPAAARSGRSSCRASRSSAS